MLILSMRRTNTHDATPTGQRHFVSYYVA